MNLRNDIFTRVAAFAALGAMFECGRLDAAPTNAPPATTSSPRRHKFQVNDPALVAKLIAQGRKPIADYGGFQIFDAADLDEKTLRDERGELRDDYDVIQLHAGKIDTTTLEAAALKRAVGSFLGKRLHLIQFIGPPKPEWRDALANTGVRIVTYIPQNSYLVYGDAKSLAALQAHARATAHVQWEARFLDEYKIHPNARAPGTDEFSIQLLADADENPVTLRLIGRLKLAPIRRQYEILDYVNVIVRIPPSRLEDIAARPEVVSIHPYHEPKKHDERQNIIITGNLSGNSPGAPGYLAWLTNKGFSQAQFTASGFAVDVSDSGIDDGSTIPNHFGLFELGDLSGTSRVIYSRLEGSPHAGSTLAGCDGHGAINAHIIGGYNNQPNGFPHTDSAGYHYGLGVCPFVKLGSSVIFDPDFFTDPNIPNLQSRAYNDGARISNNSWGGGATGDYDSDSQTYDALVRDAQPDGSAFATAGNQEMVIVFSSGNDGPGAGTVGSPGTAKNVITVGAAENVHSHSTANGGNSTTGSDGCATPDSDASSANDMVDFSSRGPCADGRQKPDLVAPGSHVTGGVAQDSPAPSPASTGNDLACYDGSGVCALPGSGTPGDPDNFFPLTQQFYTTSSGTSHSTPAVAGGCALLRQFFLNNGSNAPSPAMSKAFLLNSARYMNGTGANDTLWSASQGMGEMNLGFAFDGVPRVLRDQLAADKFTASGQTRSITNTVSDSTKPVRVTLAWTDAPGATSGNAYNNNLDLTVTVGGNTYKGNVFSGANSVTGGSADVRNNAESVFLPAGFSGMIVVTVTATSINSDGVPNEAPALDQDYALAVYNVGAGLNIVGNGAMLAAESCATANSLVDPNEFVTVNFALQNTGPAPTTNLVATLQATGGISSPSGPQTYGAIATGGASVTQAFSFVAGGNCGSTVTATLQLQDGGASYGNVSFHFNLGQLATNVLQNFDGVSTPNLPAGWTTAKSGGQANWITSATSSDTSPNAAFSAEPPAVGINELVSPVIAVSSASERLTFRHSYDMEAAASGTVAYDGGVLEIKIGGGTFTNIIAAGGSFAAGGYTHTISSSFGNPLGGRQAWSGNSAGFVSTIVALPPSAAGQNVQFKWRCGTDSSTSKNGWSVDTVAMESPACCIPAPYILTQPQSISGSVGTNAAFSVSAGGAPMLTYQWRFNGSNISGATLSAFTVTNAQAASVGSYSVVVSNSAGNVTSSDAVLALTEAPAIQAQPQSREVLPGENATFTVLASGMPSPAYQWRFNAAGLSGETQSSFTRVNVQSNQLGNYDVLVTNAAGSITSAIARLSFVTNPVLRDATLSNGLLRFVLSGNTGRNYLVEKSSDLTNWNGVTTLSNLTGQVPFVETNAAGTNPLRVYRAKLVP